MNHRILFLSALLLCAAGAGAQETQRQYLSGHGIDDAVTWDFFVSAGNRSGQWSTIPVPSCWDVVGFGALSYGRGDPVSNEQGKYRHTFQAPADWKGQKVYLVFEGSMTDTQAWVNGTSAGPMHQGSYYRFKYDVTSTIKLGAENLLEVTVDKESANRSVNNAERRADYWNYGGIFRPVYLEAVPPQHLERVAIDARHDGTFGMDVYTTDVTGASTIEAQVMDLAGNPVGPAFTASLADGKAHLAAKIDSPRQWTAETPNLYQVEVRLNQGNAVVHKMKQKFGFRTIEVRAGDGVYVNGQRIMLKGTCRHSFWPDSGRATSPRLSQMDVAIMKEMNNNAVRMSHYPPDDHFLEACDEMGLYVLDELGGWHQSYDTPTGARLIGEMITHDVNHPSILFWDNGNEGGWNRANDDEFAKWDPQQRHVLHPWEPFRDMDTKHYLSFGETKQRCEGNVIFMPTEFLHGMFDGGLGAGLEEYWNVMQASKVCAGGFLWAYADETVKRGDKDGKLDSAGNQAPDGIVGPYREKEGSFYTVKQIWSPIQVKYDQNALTIENRYDFTNTDRCTFTWELRRFHPPIDGQAGYTVSASGKLSPAIAPHAKGTAALDLPAAELRRSDALAVRVNDPNGKELWTFVWPLPGPVPALPPKAGSAPVATSQGNTLQVSAGHIVAVFSKETGYLTSISRDGKSIDFSNGPRLATGSAKLEKFEQKMDGDELLINLTYAGDMQSVQWRIRPDGWMELSYQYSLEGAHDFFGVSFDLPEAKVKSMRWLGNGPFRVWKNRMVGGTLNVWENAYNNTQTGFTDWKYPEFKGYYSQVRWMQLNTTDGDILAQIDDPSAFVQVLRPEFPGDPKPGGNVNQMLSGNAWAMFPEAGFSILNAIPPIGSKFRTAESTGPQGQKAVANGQYKGTIRLHFGPLE